MYDAKDVKRLASGRWADILAAVAGLPAVVLDGRHHPCPRCGGSDRFRFTDDDGDGSLICNQCARRSCGDGLASVQWALGCDFPAAVQRVGEYIGAPPAANGKPQRARKTAVDPSKDLQPLPWSDSLAALWCSRKRPILPGAILAASGRLARYRQRHTVIDLPVIGHRGETTGHVIANVTGGTLPRFDQAGKLIGQVKTKLTWGSQPGLIGRLPGHETTILVKTEGPSDVLALLSAAELPPTVAVVTNEAGAGQKPQPWILQSAAGKKVWVVGDADQPGEQGAALWASAFAGHAAEVRHVRLPYPVTADHGRDLRDWLAEGHGWADFVALAAAAPIVQPSSQPASKALPEAVDDPHRLARLNLERYATNNQGRTLRFWRSEWFVWKRNRYRKIGEDELRAKLAASVKQEFDRAYQAAQTSDVRKVTGGLISNVILATSGYVNLSAEVEFGTWLEDRSRRNYVSMQNGILDIDAVLAGKEEDECLLPHSPQWFSLVSVPYSFDSDAGAEPTRWLAYLDRVLESDHERIAILQEWAGYLLTPDTGQQCFMISEGDGGNGKSVSEAALTAMLGVDNVANVPLEVFGVRFQLTHTIGKLANFCGDAGEIDKVAEGHVKAFTSGNRMNFDRKGEDPIDATPTARLMISCNNVPRFSDRTDGIWRRMILLPFRTKILPHERVIGMDKREWWEASGELPAIFNWALLGLARLRERKQFTISRVAEEAKEQFREEFNPARAFLKDSCELSQSGLIVANLLYRIYCDWIKENGHRPLSEKQFGRELSRCFPSVKRIRKGDRGNQKWCYEMLQFTKDEICGNKTYDATLF